jgi:hypothetical protein
MRGIALGQSKRNEFHRKLMRRDFSIRRPAILFDPPVQLKKPIEVAVLASRL